MMLDMQQKLHCCEKLQKKAINFRRRRTAVELAQLGEGDDSPQCGEMSRRDKRARHPLKMGDKLSPLTESYGKMSIGKK